MATDQAKYVPQPFADAPAFGLQLQADLVIGEKYRLLRPAGFGGMGTVWVARNESTGAEVAVKVLLKHEDSAESVERFRREAFAAARLSHRGIVRVFDLVELGGEAAGTLVMVMELLRGETLAALFDKKRQLDVTETLEIALPLISALTHAHAAGIVHRDLKPENVFLNVDPDGHTTPKILDFGISKLSAPEAPRITGDGALLGTPAYMSPEQARGSPDVDGRGDIFALGILLYEMLSGTNPFSTGSYHSVVAAIIERDPEPLTDIPLALWETIAKALAKSPDDRFQTVQELGAALRTASGALAPASISGSHPSFPPPTLMDPTDPTMALSSLRRSTPTMLDPYGFAKRRRRTASIVVMVFGVGLALAIGGMLFVRMGRQNAEPAAATPRSESASAAPGAPRFIPPPELEVEALPVAGGAGSTGSAPRVLLQRPLHRPGRATSTGKDAPPPAQGASFATPPDPPPAPTKPSTVVRDPGF